MRHWLYYNMCIHKASIFAWLLHALFFIISLFLFLFLSSLIPLSILVASIFHYTSLPLLCLSTSLCIKWWWFIYIFTYIYIHIYFSFYIHKYMYIYIYFSGSWWEAFWLRSRLLTFCSRSGSVGFVHEHADHPLVPLSAWLLFFPHVMYIITFFVTEISYDSMPDFCLYFYSTWYTQDWGPPRRDFCVRLGLRCILFDRAWFHRIYITH